MGQRLQTLGQSAEAVIDQVHREVEADHIRILAPSHDINVHIIRIGFPPIAEQLKALDDPDPHHTCLYPTQRLLKTLVNSADYAGEPFTLELALGEPQLAVRAFDLAILEIYRNDPRYHYQHDEIQGKIGVRDEYFSSADMLTRDQVLLQSFGFAYDDEFNRAVAVFLRYLADLTPEHQALWKGRELSGAYKGHPDFIRPTLFGEWPTKVSIFSAFLEELRLINEMSSAMGRPPLFRETPGYEDRPAHFGFLVRPTLAEFNAFVLDMDKLIADNIDKSFFGEDVSDEVEESASDGRIRVHPKGTLAMLREWVESRFKPADPQSLEQMFKAFRDVRKRRQKPAHAIEENRFEQDLLRQQRDLIVRTYNGVRTLRMIFESHPRVMAEGIEAPPPIRNGEIWTF